MTETHILMQDLEKLKEEIDEKIIKLSRIDKEIKDQEKKTEYIADKISEKLGDIIDKDKFLQFFKKPYSIIPMNKSRVLVAVPKFVNNFQVGWLWKETDTYYIYQFDQYSSWLGDAPKELLEEINFKQELQATVEGDTIFFNPENKQTIRDKLKYHLREISDNQATITRGHTFDVIAEIIDNGCLPFKPRPVNKTDIRDAKSTIKLRDYQKDAVKKFMQTGATGVFYPTGAGKSFVALYLMDIIIGKKLLVVPTRTLVDQWSYYIETNLPNLKNEIKITTYQGFRDDGSDYSMVIYDEVQRLPADTFSRLAVINAKYRLGLSASPHREDGREKYVFALTGFPIGLNWREYMTNQKKSYHPIYVHTVRSESGKLNKLAQLLDMKKKTFIFCDTIELGKKISNQYGIPFIYGQTKDRLDEVYNNKVLVVSRVMDLGVSVKDLERIIEIDFLFGSRQQELQRTGRLMHSEAETTRHDIIMTEKEIESYGKRLWALQEKGFSIKVKSE